MGARECIIGKAASGLVSQDSAKAASDLYDEQLAELKRLNTPNAESVAEARTLDALKRSTVVKKKAAVAQFRAQENIRGRLVGKRTEAAEAAMSLLDFDPTNKFVGPNVVQMGQDIENQAFARMEGLLRRFRARFANVDQLPTVAREARKATERDVVRELFGESTGSAEAKAFADGASAGMDYLRKLMNASGASIPKLTRWGLPQSHSGRSLAAIDEPGMAALSPAARRSRKAEIWTDYVLGKLDRSRMLDHNTGQPLSEPRLRQLLRSTYEEIVTGGLVNVKPGAGIGVNIVGRRAQSRFLIFKDADSWMTYQERFGDSGAVETIVNHVRGMSRDIAMLRVLGPSPDASMRFVEKLVASEAGQSALEATGTTAARQAGNLFGKPAQLRRMFELVSGRLDQPGNSTLAAIDEGNRNVLQASILGGAALSALTDRAFTFATASLFGLPQGRIIGRWLKMMVPHAIEDQEVSLRIGFGAENFMGSAIAHNRYVGELLNPSYTRTLTDSVLRASGLVRMTVAGRQAFQMEFLGELTRLRARGFNELPDAMRQGFGLYGITRADWDEFRSIAPWKDPKTGATFLRPHDLVQDPDIMEAGPLFQRRFDLADKIMGMIAAERDFAVPSTHTRSTAALTFGTQPGTGAGIIARNVATLKSFPVTLAYMAMSRTIYGRLPVMTRAKFAAQTIIGATVIGGLVVQAKQIAAGKDPRDMTDPKFMGQALTTGGGLGIYADFLAADQNRFGGSFGQTLLGPVLGQEIPKALRLTVGNVQDAGAGFGRELTDFARLMMPGRSLWYLSLAFDRLIYDEIQAGLDPNYAESFRATEQRAMREYGQEFFAPPGRGFPPERAPDLGSALGQ